MKRVKTFLVMLIFTSVFAAEVGGPPTYAQGFINHPAPTSDGKLILRVYNYARTNPELLGAAEKVAAEILEKVGVQTVWVDCPVSQAESQTYSACQSDLGTADLVLRILPQRMAEKLRVSEDALGSAQRCPESEPACELSVFYSRIDELTSNGYRADRILGYVIAHEVAHVLVGGGHSEVGIMRREWSATTLQRLSWGLGLDFTKDQSRQLQHAVRRRTKPPLQEASTEAHLSTHQ